MSHAQVIPPGAVGRPAFQSQEVSASEALQMRAETATEVLAAQAKAIIQARYFVALQNPRDVDEVRQKLISDCRRFSFADPALYKRPIGGERKTGLSIRFVEAALRYMGNCDVSPQTIYDNEMKRIVRVTVTDLETNNVQSKDLLIEKTVERRKVKEGQQVLGSRINSQGERVYIVEATEDELNVKIDAQTSKAIRQLGLRIVSGELQDECLDLIRETIAKKIESMPDADKRKLVDAFFDIGVSVEQLKKYLGVDDLSVVKDAKDIMDLRAIYQAIKNGEVSWRQIMAERETERADTEPPQAPGSQSTRTQEVLNKIKPSAPNLCEYCGKDQNKFTDPDMCCFGQAAKRRGETYTDKQNFDPKNVPGVKTGAQVFSNPNPTGGK